ncbi:MAG: peptide-methionine (S)-S-oxide reductase [Candidatus Obscuribacterales bacterium]|nr:peptide-methionine (S)-S-oxide reductase [Candidatus Obscuribacterales bacterium]
MEGVKHATSGYTGGTTKDPTYGDVCGGRTGHAEAVQVLFDPQKLAYKDLIRKYLKDFRPRRYPGDKTSQYRSAIFYEGDQQKRDATEVLKELGFDKASSEGLLEPASTFFAAEVYHQNYYEKMSVGVPKNK